MLKLALNAIGIRGKFGSSEAIYRFVDLLLTMTCAVVLSPVFLGVAGIVFLMIGRPVFFVQERSGVCGQKFFMWKFKTMQDTDAQRYKKMSARASLVLRVLRDLKLDELPQFWNVLKGDMSLVGPRPEQPHIHQELCRKIPGFQQRLSLKPGLTGWAQIHEPQASAISDASNKLAWDLDYINNHSFWFYLKVLMLTLGLVLVELPLQKLMRMFQFVFMNR